MRIRRVLIAAVTAVSLVACQASTHTKPVVFRRPAPHEPGSICGVSEQARGAQRCDNVMRDPLDERDVDGCPDVGISFPQGRATASPEADAQGVLARLAAEMRKIPRLTKVKVHSEGAQGEPSTLLKARALSTVKSLVALGIDRARWTIAIDSDAWRGGGFIWFEPWACDGAPILAQQR